MPIGPVFISHSSRDAPLAHDLVAALEAAGGFHLAGIIVESRKLVSRPRYFGCGPLGSWFLNRGTDMLLKERQELRACRPMGLGALKVSLDYAIVLFVKHTELGPCQSTASRHNPHLI